MALMPSMMGPFISEQERQMLSGIQGMTPDVQNMMLSSIVTMRAAMVSADAWRSIIVIIIGVAMLLLYKAQKIKAIYSYCWNISSLLDRPLASRQTLLKR